MNVRNFSHIIFDLDGVLWDSNSLHSQAFQIVCNRHSLKMPDYELLAGRSSEDAFELICNLNSNTLGEKIALDSAQVFANEKRAEFKILSDLIQARDEDLEAIQSKYPTAEWVIVTGASRFTLRKFLEKTEYANKFRYFVSAEDAKSTKPAPDPYLLALKIIGKPPEQCVVLEDSENGLTSAEAAGLHYYHVTNSKKECSMNHKKHTKLLKCVEFPRNI